jgi:hypothetical protein
MAGEISRTRCLGLMIRDMIEDQEMQLLDDDNKTVGKVRVGFVDVSNADEPIVFLDDGSSLAVYPASLLSPRPRREGPGGGAEARIIVRHLPRRSGA